jgi:glucosamine--fructose-6-phosphate aminotransferase (isomerizing)
MCGIVGAVSQRNVVPILLDGLHRLEYRGYDSAGIAVIGTSNNIERVRRQGKVKVLEEGVADSGIKGNTGIAHTRWATHGSPSERNAHPHVAGDRIVLVHNGIIENYIELKRQLPPEIELHSDTDSEIVAALISQELASGQSKNLLGAVQTIVKKLEGAYAIAVLDAQQPDYMVVARCGSPVAIGLGLGEHFVASDPLALHKVSQEFIYLEEQDIAELTLDAVNIYDFAGNKVTREVHNRLLHCEVADKGNYRHFMQKEIFAQTEAITSTLAGRISHGHILEQAFGRQAAAIFNQTQSVTLVACGSSYIAGMIARNWLESIAGIPCQVEIASEFRYRKRVVTKGTLFVTISQSGETADTIAALADIKNDPVGTYVGTLTICNVPESTLVRSSELVLLTHAGPEIGVASTKGFMTQLVALFMLTLALGRRASLATDQAAELVAQLSRLPQVVDEFLKLDGKIKKLAQRFADKHNALFLGRGPFFPVALEGALKLKELSYIHAEAYPAGELKHGPLALVDKDMPVVVLAPNDSLLPKLKSNIQEVDTRGGQLIVITPKSTHITASENIFILEVPEVATSLAPMAYVIPIQLLAYHVAVQKGTDVDQPRNLAKSVTVE